MKELAKAVALMTREFRRGGDRREYRGQERRHFKEGGRREENVNIDDEERREEEKKITYRSEGQKEEVKDGSFKCGKPGHFAAECWSEAPKASQKGPRDAAYFKRKAEYYTQKFWWHRPHEAQKGLLAWEDLDTKDEIFCGMEKVVEEASNLVISEKRLKRKLSFYEKEVPLLTEEKTRFFQMSTEAQNNLVNLDKSSKEKLLKVNKDLEDKVNELRKIKHEMTNVVSVKEFFQKEREFLHEDILDRELKIRKFQDAQNVFKKIRVNMGRRGLGFSEFDSKPGFKTNKSMKDIFKSAKNLRGSITDSKSIFKKRRLMNVQKTSTPLVFTNVTFEDYIDSLSPSEKKNSIQRKFMSQSQMETFRFGQPETQENCAFVCFVRPLERKLSSDAPEFVPTLKTNSISDNSDLLATTNSESLCREQSLNRSDGPVLIDRDLLISDSEYEFLSDTESEACSKVSMPTSLSNEPSFKDSDTSELLSLTDSEESSSQVIETDICVHTLTKQELSNPSIPKKSKTKLKDALAYFKQANQKGPNFKWKKPCVSTWVIDSGCWRHMTGTLKLLSSYIMQEGSSVAFGGNQKGRIK
ncbi:hypothetical protein OSB04_011938 [Centaurea solstitialis]|uniref:CCHC-type domain-containing protein n=1 Tax=Centaurea solstitialis TaxID=347529 RepID=A0AA38TAE5_9ASTR|nr:hypothetical protein OSB04_011938 [Centaurea solstitialis]